MSHDAGPSGSDRNGTWERSLLDGSFEEVFAALEEVVARLEDGRLPLAESLACYELGIKLAARCDRFLDEAELRVSRLEDLANRMEDEVEHGYGGRPT